jgi:hypothetical protein
MVKHRQLARQVGVRVEDPLANSMASFQFTRSVPSQGTTFIFGLWESVSSVTSSGAATTFLGLDLFQSEDSRNRSRLGQRDLAIDLQEANASKSLSILEEDLDSLLQKSKAIVCRGASGCCGVNSLMITSTPEGRFVHWKGMSLSDLLEADDRLMAHLEPLPFQEGRLLATVVEGSTELVDASSNELVSRQVLMA